MRQISKTILILAICIGTGLGTGLLNASNPTRITRATLEAQQRRPHPGRPIQKERIMNDKDFQYLYKVIKKKSFDKDRLELLSIGVLDNYFSCRQCAKLISISSFDTDKLNMLEVMAKHIVDLENVDIILESFKFDSDKRKAAKVLGMYR